MSSWRRRRKRGSVVRYIVWLRGVVAVWGGRDQSQHRPGGGIEVLLLEQAMDGDGRELGRGQLSICASAAIPGVES